MTTRLWGQDQLVNQTITSTQYRPQIARLDNGNIVIVWQDNADPSDPIVARIFGPDGTPITGEFSLGAGSNGGNLPVITAQVGGGFIAMWNQSGGTIAYNYYSATGAPVTNGYSVAVNGSTLTNPSVISAAASGAVVYAYQINSDIAVTSAGGSPWTSTVTTAANAQISPDIALLTTGNYVAAWTTNSTANGVSARILDQSGGMPNAEFVVNTTSYVNSTGELPSIAALQNGAFLITWGTQGSPEPGAQTYDIRGRIFNFQGVAIGPDFLVNSRTSGSQDYPEAVALPDGGFMIFWVASGTVRGQRFDNVGGRVDQEFLVSTEAVSFGNRNLSATLLSDGRIAVTWGGAGLGDSAGVHLQIVDPREGMIEGTSGNDTLYGGAYDDQVLALGGADTIYAGGGRDVVYGGAGFDVLFGEDGDDALYGQDGNDNIYAGQGADLLVGGAGDDLLRGDAGDDVMQGGDGVDTALYFGARADHLIRRGPDGTWRVTDARVGSPNGTDTLTGVESFYFSEGVGNYGLPASVGADFGGDGVSDLLFRNTANQNVVMWSGGRSANSVLAGAVPANLDIRKGDLRGDGRTDLIFISAAGQVSAWENGDSAQSRVLGDVGARWKIAATGDFDGDGKTDILFRNLDTNDLITWGGGDAAQSTYKGNLGAVWTTLAADITGDGKVDLVFQNSSNGDLVTWRGGDSNQSVYLGSVGTSWRLATAGDYDGDGRFDLVFQSRSTGDIVVWRGADPINSYVAGRAAVGAGLLSGDYTGDGRSDLIVREGTQVNLWVSGIGSAPNASVIAGLGAQWEVYGGESDLLPVGVNPVTAAELDDLGGVLLAAAPAPAVEPAADPAPGAALAGGSGGWSLELLPA